MDRARTGKFSSARSLIGLVEHGGTWQIPRLGNRLFLVAVLGQAMVMGPTPQLRAQNGEPRVQVAPPAATVSVENFPLEPAPRSVRLEGSAPPTGTEGKPRSILLRAAIPAPTEAPAQATAGGVKRDQVEHDITDRSIDVKSLRTETLERLKELETRADNQILKAILAERQLRLDEHDHTVKELQELTHPKVNPELQEASAHSEFEHLQSQLAQPAQSLLPPVFRVSTTELTDAARNEMKDAIEATENDLKEWQARLETARAELAQAGSTQSALRRQRDKLFQQVATRKPRGQERPSVPNGPARRRPVSWRMSARSTPIWRRRSRRSGSRLSRRSSSGRRSSPLSASSTSRLQELISNSIASCSTR